MRRLAFAFFLCASLLPAPAAWASSGSTGGCTSSRFGGSIVCDGEIVLTLPGTTTAPPPPPNPAGPAQAAPTTPPPTLVPYLVSGPDGLCMSEGPADNANLPIEMYLDTGSVAPCPAVAAGPAPAPAPVNPVDFAVQFWQTIPLPVPRPTIPPGYAITGKPAYLVTNGTLAPAPYQRATPLGPLTIVAHGSYRVDWGDSTSPTWTGPFESEGLAYPNGNIFHTYDNAGTVTVTVQEVWTATWSLGAATGTLEALHTTATIAGFPVRQIQAVITG